MENLFLKANVGLLLEETQKITLLNSGILQLGNVIILIELSKKVLHYLEIIVQQV
jgi:hypothetical protein